MSALMLVKIIIAVLFGLVLAVLIGLAELLSQLPRYKNYWRKNNQQPSRPGELVYVALGNSAAQGVGATSPRKGYVGLIAKELEAATGKSVRIVNLSKSGARIRDVLGSQLQKYQALKLNSKHIATIEIGANDIIDFDKTKFEKEMNELMSRLPNSVVMSDLATLKGSRMAKYDKDVQQANKIMYRLAKKYNRQLAGINKLSLQNHGLRVFSIDILHPSNYGYRTNWTPAFMEMIKKSGQI